MTLFNARTSVLNNVTCLTEIGTLMHSIFRRSVNFSTLPYNNKVSKLVFTKLPHLISNTQSADDFFKMDDFNYIWIYNKLI